jgi:hypothetical protein
VKSTAMPPPRWCSGRSISRFVHRVRACIITIVKRNLMRAVRPSPPAYTILVLRQLRYGHGGLYECGLLQHPVFHLHHMINEKKPHPEQKPVRIRRAPQTRPDWRTAVFASRSTKVPRSEDLQRRTSVNKPQSFCNKAARRTLLNHHRQTSPNTSDPTTSPTRSRRRCPGHPRSRLTQPPQRPMSYSRFQ